MSVEAISAAALQNAMPASQSSAVRTIELLPPGSDGSGGAAIVSRASSASDAGLQVRFREAMTRTESVGASNAVGDVPAPIKGLFDALDQINVQARSVSDYAMTAEASGGQLTPGEIVQLTMKCQEFMFQCQLTSNIANRSSEGVQQLFRQQG